MVAVMIGIDPHKRSNTAVVLDRAEKVLARRRFNNDGPGYRELKAFVKAWKQRTWAVEGAGGVGLSLAQRLAMEGEYVLDVPACLSARVRALGGGSGRKTDDADAYAVAVAGLRGHDLQVVRPEDGVAVLKMLSDRRQQLVEQRIAAINRLHDVLQDLLPGGASTRLTATKALEILATITPHGPVERTRKDIAVDHAQDVAALDVKVKAVAKQIERAVADKPSRVNEIRGIGAVGTALILGEVADVRRFPSKHHFASYTGTAPIDVSSGDQDRHRLNRGGNRRLNYALHVAALVQIRFAGPGQTYYLRKRAEGKKPLEAMRCLKRRLSDVVFHALQQDLQLRLEAAGPEGHSGATLQSSASDPTPMVSPSDQSLTGPAAPNATRPRKKVKVAS
jgi:transposase